MQINRLISNNIIIILCQSDKTRISDLLKLIKSVLDLKVLLSYLKMLLIILDNSFLKFRTSRKLFLFMPKKLDVFVY